MSADFWAGYISGAASILIGNPLDIVKVRLQAGSSASLSSLSSSSSSSSSSSTSLRRVAALATGAAAPILGYGALNALLFVSYRQAEDVLRRSSSGTSLTGRPDLPSSSSSSSPASGLEPPLPTSLTVTWLAGAVAGLATWIVSTPTELIKCRAQTSSSSSSWSIARHVYRAEGLRGFFLGGTVTALRDSIGYGFYFWSYQLSTQAWQRMARPSYADVSSRNSLDSMDSMDGTATTGGSNSAAATLLCGGLAGIVTWASVFPLDVIKTRVQAQALSRKPAPPRPRPQPSETSPLLAAADTSATSRRLSTLEITRLAYREGGAAVFFRGFGVCSVRAFVVNAVQWAVYEWIMRELGTQPKT